MSKRELAEQIYVTWLQGAQNLNLLSDAEQFQLFETTALLAKRAALSFNAMMGDWTK